MESGDGLTLGPDKGAADGPVLLPSGDARIIRHLANYASGEGQHHECGRAIDADLHGKTTWGM